MWTTSAYLTRRKEKIRLSLAINLIFRFGFDCTLLFLAHKITKVGDKSYMLLRTNKRSDRMEIIDCVEIFKKT